MEESIGKERIEILLVEDNPGDERLTKEALLEGETASHLSVAKDGVEAMAFLRREGPYADAPRPDLILLDLNLPRKDGREVLAEINADQDLRNIPVIILTMSQEDADIMKTLDLRATAYIIKPVDVEQLTGVIALVAGQRPGVSEPTEN